MFMMPTIDMVATGKNIERLRKVAGLSVRDLQDVFGFATPQAIYKWQHGTAMPTIDNLVVLAALLQVKVDDILVVPLRKQKMPSSGIGSRTSENKLPLQANPSYKMLPTRKAAIKNHRQLPRKHLSVKNRPAFRRPVSLCFSLFYSS